MSFKDVPEILDCLVEEESSPLIRFNNLQKLRMRALRKGEIDDDEHKIVNQMASGELALMRLGIEDKKANADSEIAIMMAQQLAKLNMRPDRAPGTGTQPEFDDTSSIDTYAISEEAMRLADTVTIEELDISVE